MRVRLRCCGRRGGRSCRRAGDRSGQWRARGSGRSSSWGDPPHLDGRRRHVLNRRRRRSCIRSGRWCRGDWHRRWRRRLSLHRDRSSGSRKPRWCGCGWRRHEACSGGRLAHSRRTADRRTGWHWSREERCGRRSTRHSVGSGGGMRRRCLATGRVHWGPCHRVRAHRRGGGGWGGVGGGHAGVVCGELLQVCEWNSLVLAFGQDGISTLVWRPLTYSVLALVLGHLLSVMHRRRRPRIHGLWRTRHGRMSGRMRRSARQ